MPRSYTKRNSEYWNRHSSQKATASQPPSAAPAPTVPFPEITYGSTQYARAADLSGGAPDSLVRGPQMNTGTADPTNFQNIRALPSVFTSKLGGMGPGEYTGTSEAIQLCIRAWTGISVARNAVEVAVEFSSQPLYVKCKNETVRTFFTEWLQSAQIPRLIPQFFRGYYREGTVFLYSSLGKFGKENYAKLQSAFGARSDKIPIRYQVLNPANVFVPSGLSFPYTYVRMFSTWECERLRNPITEQDRQVFEDLPKEAKDQIRNSTHTPEGIYINMDPTRLRFAMYKAQGWEPMGVPMLWPVLPDIEAKLTLRKMDLRLARTIEHAILLVTTGEGPNEFNRGNGINQNNIARLQSLFSNHTIGRVLVADYTTKAEWLIPDIQEILGPEKYQIINEDIKDGLQSILSGGDKFANAQIKAQIFIQRLEEGQNAFLNDFLMPEVKAICEKMNFRTIPTIGFEPINLRDETTFARIVTQLAQLGILTGPQAVEAIQSQVLPDADEMASGQEEWKKARDKGLYNPLVGGQKEDPAASPTGRPPGVNTKLSGPRNSAPMGLGKGAADAFSMKTYVTCLRESQAVASAVEKALKRRYHLKGELNAAQAKVAHTLVKTVIATQPRDKWQESVAGVLASPPAISPEVANELDEIAATYEVDEFDAALLRHCRTTAPAAVAA